MRLKLYVLFFVLCLVNDSFSQDISVSSFKLLNTDLTANTKGTSAIDQNGETAALIKVVTTEVGFNFDCGMLGIVKTEYTPGEIWVYLPRGAQKITIKHPQLGVLRNYFFPIPIEGGKTYELRLTTGEIKTIVKHVSNSQYLVFNVTPLNAVVELEGELLPINNGIAQKFVKLGTYNYRIQAKNYHTATGKVVVDDPNNKKSVTINLEPAFGWIEIPASEELTGAQVFVDNEFAGYIPLKTNALPSGEHLIKIVKQLYTPLSTSIIVKDYETTQFKPVLSPNYSEIVVSVDNDAEIIINEEKKGVGIWKGKLEPGSYLIKACKKGYRESTQSIDINNNQKPQSIKLKSPTPIYGAVNITSEPNIADVFIDEEKVGQTPMYVPNLLIGVHSIKINSDGYSPYIEMIHIAEDDNLNVNAKLKKKSEVNYSSTNINSALSNNQNSTPNDQDMNLRLASNLTLNKAIKTNSGLELHMTYEASDKDWLSLSPRTYIKSTYGDKRYILQNADGIALSPNKITYKKAQKVIFVLRFPSIPDDVSSIDLIEPGSPWNFKSITIK